MLPGQRWSSEIEDALNRARCVLVVWSEASIKSHWVKEEVAEGWRRGILVPVRVDEIQVPFGYRSIQTANLIDWDGTATNPEFAKLVKAITDLVPEKASSTVQSEGRQDTRAPADIGYESPMTTRPDSSKSRTVDSSARVVGIELGATNSVVAVMKGGQLMVIPNQQDVRSTPSIVALQRVVNYSWETWPSVRR
jgi:hypothetical protein